MQDLSERDLRIARLIADGYTYREIGVRLNVSERTAKAYTDTLRKKLGVKQKRAVPQLLRRLGVDF